MYVARTPNMNVKMEEYEVVIKFRMRYGIEI
jgi:hypothetical protein